MSIREKVLNTKKVKFTKYDGTSDPYLHLCIYSDEVLLITMDDDLHANLFSMTLIDDSLEWFAKLPHSSIDNFDQLKSFFRIIYHIHISKKVTLSDFMKIK